MDGNNGQTHEADLLAREHDHLCPEQASLKALKSI
jgi:hypothetical protein